MDTWRDVLRRLPQDLRVRLLIDMSVNVRTFQRWIDGKTLPHPPAFQRLLKCLPLIFQACMFHVLCGDPHFAHFAPLVEHAQYIPPDFIERVMSAATITPPDLRFSTAMQLALMQLRMLLDPARQGMCAALFCCVPDADGCVRRLQLRGGLGSHPWQDVLWNDCRFVGCESMVGRSIMTRTVLSFSDACRETVLSPHHDERVMSAITVPIQRGECVAGVLLVCSTQVDFFRAAHRSYIEQYAALLGMIFPEHEWYRPEQIVLADATVLKP